MKVMLAVHCFFPRHFYGTETYTLELARGLAARGHEVTVLTAVSPGDPEPESEVTRYGYQGIPVILVGGMRPARSIADSYHRPDHVPTLRGILRDERPDLLHVTHLLNHTGALLAAAAAEKVPTMATFTDFFGICYNAKLEAADGSHCPGPDRRRVNCLACYLRDAGLPRPRLAANVFTLARHLPVIRRGFVAQTVEETAHRPDIMRDLFRHYRLAITASAVMKKEYERNGCPAPMREVRFGVTIDRSPKPPVGDNAPLRVGFIGQIAPWKGPDLLVEAVRACRPGSVTCTIWGDLGQVPTFTRGLRSSAEGLPVEFGGTFPKEEMAAVFSTLDLLVIPSRWYENCPLVLLNALATHTPVIVSDVEGMTEFIEPGRSGFTFPLGDQEALSRLLRGLAEEPARVRSLSATTAYPRTVDDMVDETESLQRRVLDGTP